MVEKSTALRFHDRLNYEKENDTLFDMVFCYLTDRNLMEDFINYCDQGYSSCDNRIWNEELKEYVKNNFNKYKYRNGDDK